mmetsp:Transcript_34789/g.33107  ORF Transcript_34789/g.33107 Transcript_34789/m.33107 type:complete len:293 (+) Transcript_34789:146-1024(+)
MNSFYIIIVSLILLADTGLLLAFTSSLRHPSPSIISRLSPLSSTREKVVELASDKGVIKEIISFGQGRKIETGDILAIEYSAYVKGSKSPFAKGNREQFIVKDGSLIKGWDIAIESMRIGEVAKVKINNSYAYGAKGVSPVIPAGADLEIEMKVLAWLGNQLRPESLFSKDLDIDPFIASTPEAIQADYEDMQSQKSDKYDGGIVQIYIRRIKNISLGFGGSNFFASQSGEKAPWYLNPNVTFPTMIAIVMAAFIVTFTNGSVKEKGQPKTDLEFASTQNVETIQKESTYFS